MKTFSCAAPYGRGGLGRHLEELVESARTDHTLARYYTTRGQEGDPAAVPVREPLSPQLNRWTPIRFNQSWRALCANALFDWKVSQTIRPASTHVGFSLQALRTFGALRETGGARLELVSPTSHIDQVWLRHQAAYRANPVARTWLNERQRRNALLEYEAADAIIVASDYVRDSFLDAGIPAEKLTRFDLTVPERFRPAEGPPHDGTFRVVYVGTLSVHKGVPILLAAFSSFSPRNAVLTLVGSSGTRGMRRYVAAHCARDPRIRLAPGDPLPHLQRADVYVHPSYEDGWAYAAAEALACGVPVVVTQDTGMKELVRDGVNGLVVETGSTEAIADALWSFYPSASTSPTVVPSKS